jgi:hypothetical protein
MPSAADALDHTVNRIACAPGSTSGSRWSVWPAEASTSVITEADPPDAGTSLSPSSIPVKPKTIVSFGLHRICVGVPLVV